MKRLAKLSRATSWAAGLALFVAAGFLVVRLSSSLGNGRKTSDPGRNPGASIVLVTIDTLRADALDVTRTPVMSRLAAAGLRVRTAYAHNVMTLPSHANILSGRLPVEHAVRDNSGFRFPRTLDTLATLLKAHGYRTGAFVSAFPLDSRFGLDRGFDVYDDTFAESARPAFLIQERRGADTVGRAIAWIKANNSGPFFCWIHLYEPHYPYAAVEPFASRFPGNPYASDVASADAALAPLVDPLLAAGADANTLVVLTSDHGESLGEHGEATHGIFAYEPTLRVPLLFYGPRVWQPSVVTGPAFHVDVLPTILDALDVPAPSGLPGRSLIAATADDRGPDRAAYFEALSGTLGRGWAPLRGIVRGGLKYIDLPIPELYDVVRDPEELRNVAQAQPERVDEMRTVLRRYVSGDRASGAVGESADTRERLRALGYVGSSVAPRSSYTADDDPKRLIELDRMLQEVLGLYLDGNLAGAVDRCGDLVRRRPSMSISHVYLAQLERERGNVPAAVAALETARRLNPGDAETASLLAAYLIEAGRAREAVDVLAPFARAEEPDVQVVTSYALALARVGRAGEALALLEGARQNDPASTAILVHAGTVHLMANRPDRARESFEQALALNPSLARAHSSLGAIAADRGDRALAMAHWREAVAIDPAEYRTLLAVSASLSGRGRATEARPYLEFFTSTAPPSRFASDIARVREFLARDVR